MHTIDGSSTSVPDLDSDTGAELAETLLHLYLCALAMLGAATLFLS